MQTPHHKEWKWERCRSDSTDSYGEARREKCLESGAPSISSKRGRQCKCTTEEDFIILLMLAAAKAHIYVYLKSYRRSVNIG